MARQPADGAPPGLRPLAGESNPPADVAGDGQSPLDTALRERDRQEPRQFWQNGTASHPPRTAGLAGTRIREARLERQGPAPPDHDLQHLPPVLADDRQAV